MRRSKAMFTRRKRILTFALLSLVLAFSAPAAEANPNEFETIARHLKTQYRAKKVRIPFMWLAKAAVWVVRPAGVKSFNVTLFKDLKFSRETLHMEMQAAM